MTQCTAKSRRSGEQCKAKAVKGYTVCRMHGAGSPNVGRPGGGPIITGRYSIKRAELAEKATAFANDPNPSDLSAELSLMRVLLQSYLDRFEDGVTLPYADIERIFGMIDAIGRMIERIAKILNSSALTQAEVKYLQARIVDLLNVYVPDERKRIQFMVELSASFGIHEGADSAYIDAER